MEHNTHIPRIVSVEYAVDLYWNKPRIGATDIMELFGVKRPTATRLKKIANEYMSENGIMTLGYKYIDTAAAYKAWGLSIDDLEKRQAKIDKLNKLKAERIRAEMLLKHECAGEPA